MNLAGLLPLFDNVLPRELLDLQEKAASGPVVLDLPQSARPPVLSRLFQAWERPVLFLSGRVDAIPLWQQALTDWLPAESEILRFLEPTPLPNEHGPWSSSSRNARLSVLSRLMENQHPLTPTTPGRWIVLSSARAILQKTLPKRRFLSSTRVLKVGQIVSFEKITSDLKASGYEQASVVESSGQFSRRGGILDIFPVGGEPYRIELFGDQLESIRLFAPSTQRSFTPEEERIDHILIPPAREVIPADAAMLANELIEAESQQRRDLPGWRDDLVPMRSGTPTANLEFYLQMVYPRFSSLLDYFPDNTVVVVDDLLELEACIDEVHLHAEQIASEHKDYPRGYGTPLLDRGTLTTRMMQFPLIVLGSALESQGGSHANLGEHFLPGPRYGGQVRPFIMQLRNAVALDEPAVVVSQQAQRLAELWEQDVKQTSSTILHSNVETVDSLDTVPKPATVTFVQGSVLGGFSLEKRSEKENRVLLHLLTDSEVFGWIRPAPRRRLRPRPVAPETFYADISPGDYVVHSEFGIGCFEGLVVRSVGGMDREYLKVHYANGDSLYVPVHHADRLSRWIGPDDRQPRMHRLGEKNWKRAREKAQQAIDDLAEELLELYAAREEIHGHAFAPDTHWQAELEASFPYRETEDQLQAISDVKTDMERPNPMDRLICGDVGYGKTEVALRAAFKAVMDGKQVAMLVPTTVLAQQHYNTFLERLKAFPVNVEMLSRFRRQARQEEIVRQIRSGEIDIVIGTHRLFSDDVSFKDLGLLIIDEEQRFGVSHKEKLKQMRTEVDVLTMTATPIPRTLYMSLAGVRDISQIDTPPSDRLPVQTFVGEADDSIIRTAVLRELDRGGQVFFVHNRVQTIDNVYIKLSALVPEARIAIGHGQMSERELEEVMFNFVEGEIDVLVSTSIIESGLDIPNANTLIVDRADQFGLAQLYQLRGRVGRGVRRAYAYFLHHPWSGMTPEAQSRLETISSQTELGAGYNIAMRDLEIRGAGDLLGARQSGHIADVGFDLYTRLLSIAVRKRKAEKRGETVATDIPEDTLIDLPLPAYIPMDYVPDTSLRLRLYRRMAGLNTMAEIDEMAKELADRFGAIPDPVEHLLFQLRIKVLAIRAGIPSVTTEAGQIQVRFQQELDFGRMNLQRFLGNGVRVSKKAIWLGRELGTNEWRIGLVRVLEKLNEYDLNQHRVTARLAL